MLRKVLYNSGEISRCIRDLFEKPSSSDRRVILVAYIGRKYADFLPDVDGIEIICSPTAGATSVVAVADLKRSGALIKFSDNLHMKVYWSAERGCLVTSANLSTHALQRGKLKEFGVMLDAHDIKIDNLIKEAKPYDITSSHLKALKKKEALIDRAMARAGLRAAGSGFQYLDWYRLRKPERENWKLGDYEEACDAAAAAKELAREHAQRQPVNWLSVSKNEVHEGDWLLQLKLDRERKKVVGGFTWMYVDSVVPVGKKERMYHRDTPYQAIQLYSVGKCPYPPFSKTAAFTKAFKKAAEKNWARPTETEDSLVPSKQLLDQIAKEMRSN
jgi:hypothetical protein